MHSLELGDGLPVAAIAAAQDAVELGQVVRDGQDEELLLGGEVAVDEPAGDPDGPGDLLDRRVLHAALVEQRARGERRARARACAGAGRRRAAIGRIVARRRHG